MSDRVEIPKTNNAKVVTEYILFNAETRLYLSFGTTESLYARDAFHYPESSKDKIDKLCKDYPQFKQVKVTKIYEQLTF